MLVGVGWYLGHYQPMQQTVIRVNDTEFKMKYYVEMLKLQATNESPQYMQFLADRVVKNIEQNELIRQGALKLGVSVSEDAITKELKRSELPNTAVHRDLAEVRLLLLKLRDEYFEQQMPTSAYQRHIMAMLLESEQQASEVRTRLEKGESFTELAEELSLHPLAQTNQGDFGWHPKEILQELLGANIVEYAFSSEVGALSEPIYDEEVTKPIGYWLIRVLAKNEEEEEAHVQAILLGSQAEAEEVRERLEAGEDFATLAKEFSQLPGVEENEGDLGTLIPGMMSVTFDEFVFDPELELEVISQPLRDEEVTTEGGYWLVKVVGEEEDRPLAEDDRELLKAKALDEWLSSLWDDPENEVDDSYLDSEKKAWAIEQALR